MNTEYAATEKVYSKDQGYIETYTGRHFHFLEPEVDIEDIAHGLSMCVRFNGQAREFYSLAEHSIVVAELMEELSLGDPFEGLMHDASEAYMSDIPAPFKQYFPELAKQDKKVDAAIRTLFKLPETITPECKRCDWMALFIEAYWLMPSRGENFHDPYKLRNRALEFKEIFRPVNFTPDQAKDVFRSMYKKLSLTRTDIPVLS